MTSHGPVVVIGSRSRFSLSPPPSSQIRVVYLLMLAMSTELPGPPHTGLPGSSAWGRDQKLALGSLILTMIAAKAAIVIGVINTQELQGKLLRADHDALVAQGQDIAVAYLARVESASHGLWRMVSGGRRQPPYVQISDLDASTSDDGALLTAGAGAQTLSNLQNFYGQVRNLYRARFRTDDTLSLYQLGSSCKASAFGRRVVRDLLRVIRVAAPRDYSLALHKTCAGHR
jgi:hypothetical protein